MNKNLRHKQFMFYFAQAEYDWWTVYDVSGGEIYKVRGEYVMQRLGADVLESCTVTEITKAASIIEAMNTLNQHRNLPKKV